MAKQYSFHREFIFLSYFANIQRDRFSAVKFLCSESQKKRGLSPSEPLPGLGMEQHQKREKLQTSGQHVKDQNQFGTV